MLAVIAERLNSSQQENLITLLAHSDEFGKLVAEGADPQLFEGDYRTFAERFVDYWRRFKEAPKAHAADLFADILEDRTNKRGITFRRILASMEQLNDAGVNADYVLGQLASFTRLQTMKASIYEAAEAVSQPTDAAIDRVEEILSDLLRARKQAFEPGTQLVDIAKLLEQSDQRDREFVFGVREIDRRFVVPARQTTTLFLAPKGFGKSWFLVNTAKQALIRRLRVGFISNEMRETQVQGRIFQSMFAVPKREAERRIELLKMKHSKDSGELRGFTFEPVSPEFDMASEHIAVELEERIKLHGHMLFENVYIKRFAPREMTVAKLTAWLDGMEATLNWTPDLLLIDNIGNVDTDVKNHRLTLGRAYEKIVALGVERNMAVVATHQVSRAGAKAEKVRTTHAAEDWSMIHASDNTITYSATEAERELGLARLYVENARGETDHFGVLITQNYQIGQFCLQSTGLTPEYEDLRRDLIRSELGEKDDRDDGYDDTQDERD